MMNSLDNMKHMLSLLESSHEDQHQKRRFPGFEDGGDNYVLRYEDESGAEHEVPFALSADGYRTVDDFLVDFQQDHPSAVVLGVESQMAETTISEQSPVDYSRIAQDMEYVYEQIADAVEELSGLIRQLPESSLSERGRRMVLAHLQTALSSNHQWLGGNMLTLEQFIEEVREHGYEDQEELEEACDVCSETDDFADAQTDTDTNLTYSKTHHHGDASATVSATAKNIDELESVLRLAGLDPELAQVHAAEPAVEPEHETAHIDMPYSAPADIGYSTDSSQLKQHLLNQMQGYLQ